MGPGLPDFTLLALTLCTTAFSGPSIFHAKFTCLPNLQTSCTHISITFVSRPSLCFMFTEINKLMILPWDQAYVDKQNPGLLNCL